MLPCDPAPALGAYEVNADILPESLPESPARRSLLTLLQPLMGKKATDQMSAQSTDVGSRVSDASAPTERSSLATSAGSRFSLLAERLTRGATMERASEATPLRKLTEGGESPVSEAEDKKAGSASPPRESKELLPQEGSPGAGTEYFRLTDMEEAAAARAAALRSPVSPSSDSLSWNPSLAGHSLEDKTAIQHKPSWFKFGAGRRNVNGTGGASRSFGAAGGGARWRQCRPTGRMPTHQE